MDRVLPAPEAASALPELPRSVRVEARLRLRLERSGGRVGLAERHEEGAFRFRFPRAARDCEAHLVNVAGGLAGGDRVDLALQLGEGTSLALTGAAAERIYRSDGPATRWDAAIRVGAGASLVWAPLPTILQNGARLHRRFVLDLDEAARLLLVEPIVLGRLASGEAFDAGQLAESWDVRIGGRRVLAEALRLDGADATRPARLGRFRAAATVMATGPISEAGFEALVAALHGLPGAEAAATRLGPVSGHGTCFTDREPPLVLARVLAEDDIALRAAMRVALAALRPGRQALPRHVANEYGWDA